MGALSPSFADALAMDAADPLRGFRGRFAAPAGLIYLDGHSLGPMPLATATRLQTAAVQEWGQGLIRSWNDQDWIGAPARVGAKIAGLIGAAVNEVIVADSTSINLFKLLVAGVRREAGRRVILVRAGDFPTDLYVAEGVAALLDGVEVKRVNEAAVLEAIDRDVAILMLTEVDYTTGLRRDMAAITRAAHAAGALVLWDLSHSVGAVEVDLTAVGADMAVGCGYKYLNGGPGAPAFLFVAERLQDELRSPLTGWMGHADPFSFSGDYAPAAGVEQFLCGTPSVLALLALEVGVDLVAEASMVAIAEKTRRLVSLFIALVDDFRGEFGVELATPRHPDRHGGHIALAHPESYAIKQALAAQGVIGDFREPDLLRCGFGALHLGFADVWQAAATLRQVLESGIWREARFRDRERVP
jgi:kynureninase